MWLPTRNGVISILCMLTLPRCYKSTITANQFHICYLYMTGHRNSVILFCFDRPLFFPDYTLQGWIYPVIWEGHNHSDNLAYVFHLAENFDNIVWHYAIVSSHAGYIFLIRFNGEAPHFMLEKLLLWWPLLLFQLLRFTSLQKFHACVSCVLASYLATNFSNILLKLETSLQ